MVNYDRKRDPSVRGVTGIKTIDIHLIKGSAGLQPVLSRLLCYLEKIKIYQRDIGMYGRSLGSVFNLFTLLGTKSLTRKQILTTSAL